MTKFNFTDRASYQTYVAAWKNQYRINSQLIRDLKQEIKDAAREGSVNLAGNLQSRKQYMRNIQNSAIIERLESKVEAQRQYLAAQAQREAA